MRTYREVLSVFEERTYWAIEKKVVKIYSLVVTRAVDVVCSFRQTLFAFYSKEEDECPDD